MSVKLVRLHYHQICLAASVLTAAFWDEDAVGRFMHPFADQYPNDVQSYWERILRIYWASPTADIILAVANKEDDTHQDGLQSQRWWQTCCRWLPLGLCESGKLGKGKALDEVVGVAVWSYEHLPLQLYQELLPRRKRSLVFSWFPRLFIPATNAIQEYLHPNRAAGAPSPEATARLIALPRAIELRAEVFNRRPCRGELATLGVLPAWQGQGVGRALVQDGLGRFEAAVGVWKGLPLVEDGFEPAVVVIASDETESFYQNCGFGDVVGSIVEGEGNPLSGVRGGAIMFWEPRARGNRMPNTEDNIREV